MNDYYVEKYLAHLLSHSASALGLGHDNRTTLVMLQDLFEFRFHFSLSSWDFTPDGKGHYRAQCRMSGMTITFGETGNGSARIFDPKNAGGPAEQVILEMFLQVLANSIPTERGERAAFEERFNSLISDISNPAIYVTDYKIVVGYEVFFVAFDFDKEDTAAYNDDPHNNSGLFFQSLGDMTAHAQHPDQFETLIEELSNYEVGTAGALIEWEFGYVSDDRDGARLFTATYMDMPHLLLTITFGGEEALGEETSQEEDQVLHFLCYKLLSTIPDDMAEEFRSALESHMNHALHPHIYQHKNAPYTINVDYGTMLITIRLG